MSQFKEPLKTFTSALTTPLTIWVVVEPVAGRRSATFVSGTIISRVATSIFRMSPGPGEPGSLVTVSRNIAWLQADGTRTGLANATWNDSNLDG